MGTFFDQLVAILLEASPYLLFGFAAAGLFRAFVPEEKVYRLLGENRFRSVLLASLIGVPLPLCSCSVIPAATALRQRGASRGATTAFLISTPETGIDSISITYALMDPIMTIVRPVAAFATALLTGSAVGVFAADDETTSAAPAASTSEKVEPGSDCCRSNSCDSEPNTSSEAGTVNKVVDGLRYAFGPLLEDLAPWLLIGFVLAAAIGAAVPEGMLAEIPQGWVSSLLMMLIATPVYICASASTPVAAALIAKGLDPGAALVLLLVGPATNIATILVVFRFMGARILAIYLAGVTTCALAFGFAINALYARLGVDLRTTISAAAHSEEVSAIKVTAAVVLTGLLVWSMRRRVLPRPPGDRETDASAVLR